jgi:site-specific DNA-methyltransferase (adenine-specific)
MIHIGDCRDVLKELPENSVDAVVTDPPYEFGFMGKDWDSTGIAYDVQMWREVRRVMKPGAHLLAFGGTRTYHRMACAVEDAGFEIRDQMQWLYGQGFPKSLDVSKAIDKAAGAKREVIGNTGRNPNRLIKFKEQDGRARNPTNEDITAPATAAAWDGWGTALKPANEPIVVARKPLSESTVAANVLRWGTGALNIDASRVESEQGCITHTGGGGHSGDEYENRTETKGRWPANVLLDEEAGKMLDEHSGVLHRRGNTNPPKRTAVSTFSNGGVDGAIDSGEGGSDGASRFFYCAKASRSDRDFGLEGEQPKKGVRTNAPCESERERRQNQG